ncbi:MAG: hypothetical protein PHF65_04595 [Oscillospiraceae bacterium]|nr:hypothetical protein [Oscillospiraceae bacterium]
MTLTSENRDRLFSERERELKFVVDDLSRQSFRMSTARMVFFLSSAGLLAIYVFADRHILILLSSFLLFIAFLSAVIIHNGINRKLAYRRKLLEVHLEHIARTEHRFDQLKDEGSDFICADHDYSSDLDLFGRGSLFHLLNVAETYLGRIKLRDLFLTASDPDKKTELILERQTAVRELFENPWLLQEIQAIGRVSCRQKRDPKAFIEYAAQETTGREITVRHLVLFASLSLVLTISVVLSVLSVINLYPLTAIVLVVQLILTAMNAERFKHSFDSVSEIHRELYMYRSLFEWIEKTAVQSKLLTEIQSFIRDEDSIRGGKASAQLAGLNRISVFIQARSQPLLFLFLNSLFLYDMYCMFFLRRWIRRSGTALRDNLELLGMWEALGSLATMHVVYPECSFPAFRKKGEDISDDAFFRANAMGHPLIPRRKQVRNDFFLPAGIALITGSNMSGKTTLLRTVGINAVLAYAGTVCCAEQLELRMMRIGSSMRIADNLEAGLSTFYAELLRIERIIGKSKSPLPMLFLIDEIFRGTNSKDRTDGAQIVIKNLLRPWVIGLMSTHDYQLCDTVKEDEGISFYHFSETYDEDGIHFDYRLAPGVSTAANARYLMKMVGIE